MRARSRGYVHRVDIGADITEVWQALVEPEWLARWYAQLARVDPREGGGYWVRADDLTREAHIDVFLPPRRLRLIYMPQPELPAGEAVMVDDFLLDRDEAATAESGQAATVLRLLGSGIPETQIWDVTYARLRGSWQRSLLRLKIALEKPYGVGRRRADSRP
jgi:uncharacterized protein YndB with AHSA1/START domain